MRDQEPDRPIAIEDQSGAPLHAQDDNSLVRAAAKVLRWNPRETEQRVQASVKHGWVTLSGLVDWQYQKNNAAADVLQIAGVVGVNNEIVVRSVIAPSRSRRRLPR